MATEIGPGTKVHPVIAALEEADEPAVVIQGFLGTSEDTVVRLYPALDTSAYVEIPKGAVIYLQAEENGKPGLVRAFVRASSDILTVRRYRVRAADWMRELPPVRGTFWPCAGECEGVFADLVADINADEAIALAKNDQQALANIQQRKMNAQQALLTCLSTCVDTYGAPQFLAVPDSTAAGGFRVTRFSLAVYFGILVARYLTIP